VLLIYPNAKEIYWEGGYDVLIVDYEIIGWTWADMILRLVKEIHPTGENRPIIIGNSANKDKDLSNHALRFFRENPFTQWHMDKDLDQYEDLEGIINKSAKKMNIYIVD
jgi:hypothetical protein